MGPVQVLVVGFGEDAQFTGAALEELRRLSDHDIVRVVDLLIVHKNADGSFDKVEVSDEHELAKLGALAGALIGFAAAGEEGAEAGAELGAELGAEGTVFDDDEVWYIADTVPEGTTAAICLLEHRWAIPLRDAIADGGGVALADRWLHPEDLLAAGLEIGMAVD
jgi:uncharacterized membrane protein